MLAIHAEAGMNIDDRGKNGMGFMGIMMISYLNGINRMNINGMSD